MKNMQVIKIMKNDGKLEVMEIMNTNSKNHQKGNIITNACANVLCEVIAPERIAGGEPSPQLQNLDKG